MPVEHLRLRKAALAVLLVVLIGIVVTASVLMTLPAYKIAALSLIAVVLFFNVSRRIYPARRILNGDSSDVVQEQSEKKEDSEKPGE